MNCLSSSVRLSNVVSGLNPHSPSCSTLRHTGGALSTKCSLRLPQNLSLSLSAQHAVEVHFNSDTLWFILFYSFPFPGLSQGKPAPAGGVDQDRASCAFSPSFVVPSFLGHHRPTLQLVGFLLFVFSLHMISVKTLTEAALSRRTSHLSNFPCFDQVRPHPPYDWYFVNIPYIRKVSDLLLCHSAISCEKCRSRFDDVHHSIQETTLGPFCFAADFFASLHTQPKLNITSKSSSPIEAG